MSQTDRITGLVGHAGMKVPVQAASTAALTLSGEQTVDGVVLTTGERILVKDQASSVANGIYVVDTGDWERAKDADGPYDFVQGSLVLVYSGTTNGNKIFKCTSADTVDVGTDALTFTGITMEFTGSSKTIWCGTATGTANALVLTPANALVSGDLNAGLSLLFKSGASANTAATTIAVSGLTAIAVQNNGNACVGGEIQASTWYRATLDASGTAFQLEAIGRGVMPQAIQWTGDLTPSQITGNQNDYAPTGIGTASVLRLSTDASRNITGISGGADGRVLKILNAGSFPIVLTTQDSASTAANRFDIDTDTTLGPDQGIVLWYDATDSRWRAARVTNGEFRSVQLFTASGTWTKPAGIKRAKVTVVGGGAGGGGAAATAGGQAAVGGGGGGGGAAISTIAASSLGATETVTVGAGGAGGVGGAAGSNGGVTSFGAHCVTTAAGGGSFSGPAAAVYCGGGSPGGASAGNVQFSGGGGGAGLGVAGQADIGGAGGGSYMGGGGQGVSVNNGGTSGGQYGGGGGGAANDGGQSARDGGAGAGGIVMVEEFF